ncbi:hypothetical protein VKT23_019232 [Stygiomarasmius scandens]|uniref:Uncharacterized protein n=1 Tax=Marasmiellus scandens TaxID=2682957 RepID=A0ABR1IP65_9AGAR
MGLELEQTCFNVQELARKVNTESSGRQRELQTLNGQRIPLREKLATFEWLRSIYMPGLLQMLMELNEEVDGASSEVTDPENVKLWLPSSIPAARCASVCIPGLPRIEDHLRTAQCNNSINSLRHTLRVKSPIIDRVYKRAKSFAQRYRRAQVAKFSLNGPGDWERVYQVLKDEDVRLYRDQSRYKKGPGRRGTNEDSWEPTEGERVEENEEMVLWNDVCTERHDVTRRENIPRVGTGETRKLNSWIWTAGPGMIMEDGADAENEVCRSEWCRSRARAQRGTEEVMLLKKEMHRMSQFLEWKEQCWKDCAKVREEDSGLEVGIKDGLTAYATKQATLYRELVISFRATWTQPLKDFKSPATDAVPACDPTDADTEQDKEDKEEDDDGE